MTNAIERPDALRINAWTVEDAPTQSLPKRTPWAQDEIVAERTAWLSLLAPVDDRSWKPPEVGPGLGLAPQEKLPSTGLGDRGCPPAIQRLLVSRTG